MSVEFSEDRLEELLIETDGDMDSEAVRGYLRSVVEGKSDAYVYDIGRKVMWKKAAFELAKARYSKEFLKK